MGAIIGFLGGRFGSYALIALAVLVAGMAITIKVQHTELGELRDSVAELKTKHVACQQANESQSKAIDTITRSSQQWKAQCTASAESAAAATTRAENYAAGVHSLAAELTKRGANDYAKLDCENLLAVDFAAACPAMADGLRQRASRR